MQRADPGSGVIELSGVGLGVRDQLLDGLERRSGCDADDKRIKSERRNHGKVPHRVVGQLFQHCRLRRVTAGNHDQRVAIGHRLRHVLIGDHASRPRARFNNHLLLERFGKFLRDQPRNNVGTAACGKAVDDTDDLGRIFLGAQ